MATYRVRPTKQIALLVGALGVVLVVLGIVFIGPGGYPVPEHPAVRAAGLFVAGYTLWAAFARKGAFQKVTADQPPPPRRGMTVTED